MCNVYHAGELSVQRLAGVEVVAQQNSKIISPYIVKGAIAFLHTQSLIVASSVDQSGRVWISFLTGEPGFINVEDEVTLTIKSNLVMNDPLKMNLILNPEIGLLAIDFSRRMRMRINGMGVFDAERRLVIKTEQVYGNCPKYIQKRSLQPSGAYHRSQKSEHRSSSLNYEQQEWIRNSDTFFIGSISSEGKLDASHRGGLPGFVKLTDDNTFYFPDYYGNSMFNTLGNMHSNPNIGILFIDFECGHSLQLTGQSKIIWDENEIALYPGAERIVRFTVEEVLYTENNTPIRWDFIEFSPANPTL